MTSKGTTNRGRVPAARTGAALATAAAVSVLLTACSGGATKLSASSGAAAAQSPSAGTPIVLEADNPKYGKILTTASGFALYVYTADLPGGAGCDSGCLKIWPPLLLPAGATTPVGGPGVSGLGTLPRGDRLEVTYGDLPLYTYVNDTAPGQVTGQDVVDSAGKWILATVPPPNVAAQAASPSTSAPATTQPPATQTPATPVPATSPPATQAPANRAPATQAPATRPPATQPAATSPPATQPPATQPPATQPPATQPPATSPPTRPPTTQPPATSPPTTAPGLPSY